MSIDALLRVGLLVVAAKLSEGVLGRIGLSAIVAYTLAGVLLGPATGIVEPTDDLQVFLSVGVSVFFFLIGLDELDLPGFKATIRGPYFVAATVSVAISVLVSLVVTSDLFGLEFALGLAFDEALAVAGILSLSSLGLAVKVLADLGILKKLIGLRIFTTVIIAEVLALLLVGVTIGEAVHETSIRGVLQLLGQIVGFAVATWFLSTKVLPVAIAFLQRWLHVSELSFGLLIGSLFVVVAGAERIGLHGSLGALLFGAAHSGLPHRMRRDIMPGIRSIADGLFVPLLFASAGLYLDLSFTALPAATIIAVAAVPIGGKFAGALIGTYLARLDTPVVLAVGLMAKGVAEIALLLVLLETGMITREVFSLLAFIMFGYILVMPSVIGLATRRAKDPERATPPSAVPPSFARHAMKGVLVGSIMDRTRAYPAPELSVRDFLNEGTVPNQSDYLVVEDDAAVGVVSLARLHRLDERSQADTPLRDLLRRNVPRAWPDEPVDDVLERMTDHSLGVIPIIERDTDRFLGSVASHDVLDLVVLMHEIEGEAQRLAAEKDPAEG
ncbi:MAG: CBS domain-containing protein [Acidobacteria bacterium]|nr:CBS domain-containing protein [Acidobacteriota bacterium]